MLSNWKNAARGVLPISKTTNEFQYRRFINWEVDLFAYGMGARVASGEWHIRIISPSNNLVFEQKVVLTLQVISLGFTGLQFFTWAFNKEVITTLSIGGTEITPENPAWKYTLGGTELSEFGTMEIGGGTSYTDKTAIIEDWWDSPVYKLQLLPGTKFEVVKDAWGLGASNRPEWQWRFRQGVLQLVDCRFGPFGEMIIARGINNHTIIQGGHSWPDHKFPVGYGFIPDASSPSIIVMDDGVRYMGLLQTDGYWEYISRDMERSWKKVEYATDVPGEKKAERIFGPEVTMPQMIRVGTNRLAISVRGTDLYIRRITESGPDRFQKIITAFGERSYALDMDETGVVHIIDSEGDSIWKSHEVGMSWQEYIQQPGTVTNA